MTLRRVFLGEQDRLRSGWAVLLFLVASAAFSGLFALFLRYAAPNPAMPLEFSDPQALIFMAPRLLSSLGATFVVCLALRKPFREAGFADPYAGRHVVGGVFLGGWLLSVAVAGPVAVGQMHLEPSGALSARALLIELVVLVLVSTAEEVALRGILFQELTRGLGRPAALLTTSALFGVLHLGNPGASWVAALNITLVGTWFGLWVYVTGSLWLCFGLHTAWNFFEGAVFGQPVSGIVLQATLFKRESSGANFWTGGSFGPEASGWVAILLAVAIVLTAWRFKDRLRPATPPVTEQAALG